MLERRKVYVEFTGNSSVLLVTPYVSKEYQLKPADNSGHIDLVSLKRCDEDDVDFYGRIEVCTTDDDGKPLSTPIYDLYIYLRQSIDSVKLIGVVSITTAENKKKFEVSYLTRD